MGLGPANSAPAALTPRIVSLLSPPWPLTLTATSGIRPRASETLWMLDLSRSAPVVTDMEMGTSCRRCSRFCAVTTISSRPAGSAVASLRAALAGRDETRKAAPGIRAAPKRSNAEFIFHPFFIVAIYIGYLHRLFIFVIDLYARRTRLHADVKVRCGITGQRYVAVVPHVVDEEHHAPVLRRRDREADAAGGDAVALRHDGRDVSPARCVSGGLLRGIARGGRQISRPAGRAEREVVLDERTGGIGRRIVDACARWEE